MSIIINDPTIGACWADVMNELARAQRLHPNYPGILDPVRCVGIITEENGEAMAEALDLTRDPSSKRVDRTDEEIVKRLYKETVETAATALRLLISIRMSAESGRVKP